MSPMRFMYAPFRNPAGDPCGVQRPSDETGYQRLSVLSRRRVGEIIGGVGGGNDG